MMARIEAAGAEVIVHGVSLSEADECARALAAARGDAAYVPPFDHELIWEGKLSVNLVLPVSLSLFTITPFEVE